MRPRPAGATPPGRRADTHGIASAPVRAMVRAHAAATHAAPAALLRRPVAPCRYPTS